MKMKKVLFPIMTAALALSLAACGGDDKKKTDKEAEGTPEDNAAMEELQAKLAEQEVDAKKVVVIVNKEELKGEQYNAVLGSIQSQMQQMGQDPTSEEMAETIKTQTIDAMIDQTVLLQSAKEKKVEATEEEIEKEYNGMVEQFGDEDTLKKALKSQDVTMDAFKAQIADSIIFKKYSEEVAPLEEISEEEVQEYYDGFVAQAEAQKKAEAEAGEEEQEGNDLPKLEEVKDEIESILKQEKQQQKIAAHIQELKEKAEIEMKI